jgi:hypothetical protein
VTADSGAGGGMALGSAGGVRSGSLRSSLLHPVCLRASYDSECPARGITFRIQHCPESAVAQHVASPLMRLPDQKR